MQIKRFYQLISFTIVLLLSISVANSQVAVSWGVELGDTAIYWIDDIRTSETGDSNLAVLLLNDANRTQIMTVTHIDPNYLNYTLGLANGTEFVPDQQIQILETDLQGQSLLLPNGSLPLILPLSAGTRSDYLSYLTSQVNFANSILDSIFSSENITEISDAEIAAVYLSDFLNITFSASLSDLGSLSTELLGNVNVTDQVSIDQNQTINDISVDVLIAYNSSDGTLMEFGIDAALNTTSVTVGSNNETITTNNILTFNATVIRQHFIDISELDVDDLVSIAEDASFFILGIIPAFYLLRRKKS